MVLAVEKPSFLVYQLLEPYFRQLFRVVKVSKLYRETFLIFIFSSKSGRNYPVVRYCRILGERGFVCFSLFCQHEHDKNLIQGSLQFPSPGVTTKMKKKIEGEKKKKKKKIIYRKEEKCWRVMFCWQEML